METASSPPAGPTTSTVRRNPHRKARRMPFTNPHISSLTSTPSLEVQDLPSYPIHDILSMEIPKIPQPHLLLPSSSTFTDASSSENLKVFLRIRPLASASLSSKKNGSSGFHQHPRSRNKNAWPQNPVLEKRNTVREKNPKKKSAEVCVSVKDSQSVRLSPPTALQESKKIKSEVYEGFSHVFASDSSQNEVYEKMLKPLVEDFLKGKSGMLAALGPSGSGKTHTVFGTPREPGMVSLALKHIFEQTRESSFNFSRSFSMSIFEIYSERGKMERVSDLSPDGGDLSMQQSTIKGLQLVTIPNAAEAESLVGRAMLKRATAMTNTNCQSSRSQCIINIHSIGNKFDVELDVQPTDTVLTIVDLAGSEREKRTGNQGSRFLESNFINNTSMVFGLCLRSLLEHQKNSKKPLQKHFQNSLLTRYLRDYMEGKKRMALILTVKPGEEDYLDTSYLLRQASPYMHIKFTNVEEQANLIHNKRHIQTLSAVEQAKRMKYSSVVEGSEGIQLLQQDSGAQRINELDSGSTESENSNCNDFTKREKSFQIMQNLAKALWSVLKQCNQKLKVAEQEIQSLSENLANEKMKYSELEKQFEDFKSCNCCKQNPVDVTLSEPETQLEAPIPSESKVHDIVDEENTVVATLSKNDTQVEAPIVEAPIPLEGNKHSSVDEGGMSAENCKLRTRPDEDTYTEINGSIYSPNFNEIECNNSCEECGCPPGQDKDVFSQAMVDVHCLHPKAEHNNTPQDVDAFIQVQEHEFSLIGKDQGETLEPPLSEVKAADSLEQCKVDMPGGETRLDASKPLNLEKPKRRLLPASSILLRDITALGIEDEHQRPKENRGGRKLAIDETKRTHGSISLLRLLQDNLRL